MNHSANTGSRPPEWALQPPVAWVYLVAVIILAFTPAFPLNWLLGIAAAVFTYQDRKAHGFPTFWWTAAVVVFGAFAYVFYVHRRPRPAVVYPPQAAMTQHARMARGLPPGGVLSQAPTSAPAGWYADPTGEARVRYWDGGTWTDHTAV